MTSIADLAHDRSRIPLDDLDAGLAAARLARGWSFIALYAPVASAPALIAAARNAALVSWSSQNMTIVGIGAALELRGSGGDRWTDIVAAARGLVIGAMPDDPLARPRLLGGVAFAPHGADHAPWTGFGDAWFMLPRWTYVSDGTRATLVLAVEPHEAQQSNRWHGELDALRAALTAGFVQRPQPPLVSIDPGDRDAWRAQVRAITDAIGRGEYAKIVAARSAIVTLDGDARAADMVAELDSRQTETARIVVRPPNAGTLIAATPERLVRREGSLVSCDALAGSAQPDAHDAHGGGAAALRASDKDRREHALVVSAIASALEGAGANVTMPSEPGIRALRHVLHLHTPITATLREPRHLLELAAALHPTPAVGGTPTLPATEWIGTHEAARGWYASPVGWFDLDGNGELAVAIRSGVLHGDRAHLWAGAGIVAGSDPDRELAETDLKLRAMLGALGVAA